MSIPTIIGKSKQTMSVSKPTYTFTPTVSGKKLVEDEGIPILTNVGIDIGKTIQQSRLDKKMTQVDLAKKLNVPVDIIKNYENGTAQRNGQLLHKIGQTLGVKLTGK